MIVVAFRGHVAESNRFVNEFNFLFLIFQKCLLPRGIQVVEGSLGKIAFKRLFSGPGNFETDSEREFLQVFDGEFVDDMFEEVDSVEFLAVDDGFTYSQLKILSDGYFTWM